MKYFDSKNYIHLDCEKGMDAVTKKIVPIDGEGSTCPDDYEAAQKCGNCANFREPDKYGIGACKGFAKEYWAYATCGAFACEGYKKQGV